MLKANKKHIIVEGNIGAGKSTFVKILAEYLEACPIFEPSKQWQHVPGDGGNLLDAFYKDIKRWAYTFQTYAFVTRVVAQERGEESCKENYLFEERSVYSDRYCFAKNCFEMGVMTGLEWSLYQQWFSWLVEGYTYKPHGFVYLRVTPKLCYDRIKIRSRSEESEIPLDYIEKIHQKHDEWLIEKKDLFPFLQDVPVLVLNTEGDFENNEIERLKLVHQVSEFYKIPLKKNI